MALLLTSIAGFIDAAGYVVLAHIFVANMSGNSVAAGLYAVERDWRLMFHRGFPVLVFVVGLILGGVVAEAQRPHGKRRAIGWCLLLESTFLGGFILYGAALIGWHGRLIPATLGAESVMVILPALAMGVQNVTLRASGALSIYTTHVTGTLTQLADDIVRWGQWMHGYLKCRSPAARRWRRLLRMTPRHPVAQEAVFLAALWVVYVIGAIGGGVGIEFWGIISVSIPFAILAVLAIFCLRFPGQPAMRNDSHLPYHHAWRHRCRR
jgi:uncharacterized membrane protein YoaK (UPF0700 family)